MVIGTEATGRGTAGVGALAFGVIWDTPGIWRTPFCAWDSAER